MRVLRLELGSGQTSIAEQMLCSLVHRALAVDPEDRYAIPGEFLVELEELLVQVGSSQDAANLCRLMRAHFSTASYQEAVGLRGAGRWQAEDLMDIEDALEHDTVTARPDPVTLASLLQQSSNDENLKRENGHWLRIAVCAFSLVVLVVLGLGLHHV